MNCERLKEEFRKLNEIDSLSFREREMADYLMPILKKLGFEVYEDDAGIEYNGNCGNLYGILSGELPGEPILLSAHMDTVEPGRGKKAIFHEDGRITSDGTTILGALLNLLRLSVEVIIIIFINMVLGESLSPVA